MQRSQSAKKRTRQTGLRSILKIKQQILVRLDARSSFANMMMTIAEGGCFPIDTSFDKLATTDILRTSE